MKRCVVCFFGVIPRSIKYTYENIKTKILEPLRKNYDVDIYGFHLHVGEDICVDSTTLNMSDSNIIPYTVYEESSQVEIDNIISNEHSKYKNAFRRDYLPNTIHNSFRQMYSEWRTGKYLERNISNYDVAIVIGPDYYFANSINISHVEDSIISKCAYLSQVNHGNGITNGYYIGPPSLLCPFLKRRERLDVCFTRHTDFEKILLLSIRYHKIPIKLTDIVFFKIRANKTVHWQTPRSRRIFYLPPDKQTTIKNDYINLQSLGFRLHDI